LEGCHNLEHHCSCIIYYCNMFIGQATEFWRLSCRSFIFSFLLSFELITKQVLEEKTHSDMVP
jgi:hypothetical protein